MYQQLKLYGEENYYPYHMPGHKRHAFGEMPESILGLDITEIDGFDNLHQPEGILKKLQESAAELYGAEESFYLINGSSSGILSAVSAALPPGGHLLMARNSHKSSYHAAYLRNLTLSYLYPAYLEEYDICDVITPEQIKEALATEPDIGAVLIVSPTYEGRIADIAEIARMVHEKGIPLIVDEAHGAHLGLYETAFSETRVHEGKKLFHANSCQLGADLVIHSVHKTLPSMTQTALLHVNGKLIDRERLRRFLHIYQSSSPSYVLMASIDNALSVVQKQGRHLFRAFRDNYLEMLEKLAACRHLQFLPIDDRQDIGKLVISSQKTGLPGQLIYDILLQEYHLQLEMAAGSYCLAMFTIGDTREAYVRMVNALLAIDGEISRGRWKPDARADNKQKSGAETGGKREPDAWADNKQKPGAETGGKREANAWAGIEQKPDLNTCGRQQSHTADAIPLEQAWDMDYELIPLQAAVGRHVAEFINLYPPGVPLLVPGEVLQELQYRQIISYLAQKLNVQGVSEEPLYLVKVICRNDFTRHCTETKNVPAQFCKNADT